MRRPDPRALGHRHPIQDGQRRQIGGTRGAGSIFSGTLDGTFDARKGRLSVPSPLRAVLAAKGSMEIVGRRSEHGPCIEMWPRPVFDEMVERRVGSLDPFSAEYNDIADRLVSEAHALSIDGEGRVVLPRDLVDHAGLNGEIAYTGRVSFFQIWDRAKLREARTARAGAQG